MSNEYERYAEQRRQLETETNRFNIKPISMEIHKRSKDEKVVIKAAKKAYQKSKENRVTFKEKRDEFIQSIVKSSIPSWGNITVGFLN